MKNRQLLHLGAKPAPDDLAFVQGFVNYVGWLKRKTDINQTEALKAWLVRHGLLVAPADVTEDDVRKAVTLQDSLRNLLRANAGETLDTGAIKQLNRLVLQCRLTILFGPDGAARLTAASQRVERALGKIIITVVNAMAGGDWWRLKECRNGACRWIFYDSSRNGSGRWCSMKVCGSRSKASAYRRRQKQRP
jgi:predicted RNA-binding Zn ribbon-like protein